VTPGPPGLDAWRPWSPNEVARRLAGLDVPWHVAGGWALDLWHGRQTRRHGDLEIAVPRERFPAVRERLAGFDLYVAGAGQVRPLPEGGVPPSDRRQVWVCDPGVRAWRMDIFCEPGDDRTWVCRRRPSGGGRRARGASGSAASESWQVWVHIRPELAKIRGRAAALADAVSR
jgi:hypothetical protein